MARAGANAVESCPQGQTQGRSRSGRAVLSPASISVVYRQVEVGAEAPRAIEAALSIPSSSLDPIPLLKLTGIYIALAAMLEAEGRQLDAYKELSFALAL